MHNLRRPANQFHLRAVSKQCDRSHQALAAHENLIFIPFNISNLIHDMKKILLIASMLIASASFAIAQSNVHLTKDQAESAIAANRSEVSKKIQTMEKRLAANSPKTQESADELYDAMVNGMKLTKNLLWVAPKDQQAAINERFLKLERSAYDFRMNKENAAAHKDVLLKAAGDFKAAY
jgi:hypothetical protein